MFARCMGSFYLIPKQSAQHRYSHTGTLFAMGNCKRYGSSCGWWVYPGIVGPHTEGINCTPFSHQQPSVHCTQTSMAGMACALVGSFTRRPRTGRSTSRPRPRSTSRYRANRTFQCLWPGRDQGLVARNKGTWNWGRTASICCDSMAVRCLFRNQSSHLRTNKPPQFLRHRLC